MRTFLLLLPPLPRGDRGGFSATIRSEPRPYGSGSSSLQARTTRSRLWLVKEPLPTGESSTRVVPHPRYCEGGGRTVCDLRPSPRNISPTSDRGEGRGNGFDSRDAPLRRLKSEPKSPASEHTVDLDIRPVYATGCVEFNVQPSLVLRLAELEPGDSDILNSVFVQRTTHSVQERRTIPLARLERLVETIGNRGNIAAFNELRQGFTNRHDAFAVRDHDNGDDDERRNGKKADSQRPRRRRTATPGPPANQHELQTARDNKKSHGVLEQKRRESRGHLAWST